MFNNVRNYVDFLTGNQILNAAILSWLSAQIIKVIICLVRRQRVNIIRMFLSSGGMPSSHTALVASLATKTGMICGLYSPEFAIAGIFAFVVMYDAAGVRRAAGEQAKILNYMMDNWNESQPEMFERDLKELLGHTPFEVIAGAALGILIALI